MNVNPSHSRFPSSLTFPDAFENTSKSYVVYLEETWNLIRSLSNSKVGGVIVIDIADCGMSFLSYVSILTKICSSGILQYPEISEKVFIINAGWLITTLWTAIKPFIPSRTEDKLTILGSNYHQVVSETLFGTSDVSTKEMTHLQSLLSTSQSPSPDNEIHSVESAYHLILEEIFTSATAAAAYPDLREFLQAARHYLDRFPSSKLALHKQNIESSLSNWSDLQGKK
jgi:hypothetical protein